MYIEQIFQKQFEDTHKRMDLEGIILSEVTQSQRNSHNMYSLISGYQPRNLGYPRYKIQFAKLMKLKKNEDQSVDNLAPSQKWEQNTHGRSYRDKIWKCDERMDHLVIAISRDPSHDQLPNAGSLFSFDTFSILCFKVRSWSAGHYLLFTVIDTDLVSLLFIWTWSFHSTIY